MKNPFSPGAQKKYQTLVTEEKIALFDEEGIVHPVYSTFALGKDAEWACRLLVLEMREAGEEGVGAYLSVEHLYPAPLGSKVEIVATLMSVEANRVHCKYEAFSNGFCIAKGEQTQKIINKQKFDALINEIGKSIQG